MLPTTMRFGKGDPIRRVGDLRNKHGSSALRSTGGLENPPHTGLMATLFHRTFARRKPCGADFNECLTLSVP